MFTFYDTYINKENTITNFIYKYAFEIAESIVANFKPVYKELKNSDRTTGVGIAIKVKKQPYNKQYDNLLFDMDIVTDIDNKTTVLAYFNSVDDIPKIGTLTDFFAEKLENFATVEMMSKI